MQYRTTIATATTIAMARRVRRPTMDVTRSMRISSLSLTTNAAPQSTSHSQVTTVSSVVQPVGRLKK